MNSVATTNDDENIAAYAATAQKAIVSHAANGWTDYDFRYNEYFYEVIIDTGCALASSGGLLQYREYCRQVGEQENIDTSKRVIYKFGISGKDSVGRAVIKFPMKESFSSSTTTLLTRIFDSF